MADCMRKDASKWWWFPASRRNCRELAESCEEGATVADKIVELLEDTAAEQDKTAESNEAIAACLEAVAVRLEMAASEARSDSVF